MLAPFFTIKSLVVTVHRCSINFLCIESQICIIKWWRETENGNTLVWVTPRSPSLSLQDIYAPHPTHISRENEAIPWECSNDDGLKNLCDLMLKPEQSVRVRLHDMVKKHHIAIILTDMASVIWFMIRGKCYFCIRTFVLNWSPLQICMSPESLSFWAKTKVWTELRKKAFRISAPNTWNNLQTDLQLQKPSNLDWV